MENTKLNKKINEIVNDLLKDTAVLNKLGIARDYNVINKTIKNKLSENLTEFEKSMYEKINSMDTSDIEEAVNDAIAKFKTTGVPERKKHNPWEIVVDDKSVDMSIIPFMNTIRYKLMIEEAENALKDYTNRADGSTFHHTIMRTSYSDSAVQCRLYNKFSHVYNNLQIDPSLTPVCMTDTKHDLDLGISSANMIFKNKEGKYFALAITNKNIPTVINEKIMEPASLTQTRFALKADAYNETFKMLCKKYPDYKNPSDDVYNELKQKSNKEGIINAFHEITPKNMNFDKIEKLNDLSKLFKDSNDATSHFEYTEEKNAILNEMKGKATDLKTKLDDYVAEVNSKVNSATERVLKSPAFNNTGRGC